MIVAVGVGDWWERVACILSGVRVVAMGWGQMVRLLADGWRFDFAVVDLLPGGGIDGARVAREVARAGIPALVFTELASLVPMDVHVARTAADLLEAVATGGVG